VHYDPTDPRWVSDPWPLYSQLRTEAPIQHSERQFWVLARHADCLSVLRDRRSSSDGLNADPDHAPEGFSSSRNRGQAMDEFLAQGTTDTRPFLFRDPPDHTRMRGLVSKAFTPRMVERMRERTVEIVDSLLDEAIERGRMDAVADFAYPLPVQIICELLGVPSEDQHRFRAWSAVLARGLDPEFLLTDEVRQARVEAIFSFAEYFFALLADRRAHPGDDLLTQLAQAEEAGDSLSEGELLSTCILLLVAGHETTVNLISGGLLALVEDPAQAARWRDDPALERTAVDELLRYVSPVQLTGRTMLDDVEVAGTVLPKGQFVLMLIGSANRDPAAFDDPERLDLGRADNRHLGFGFGLHHCLGAPLARMEAGVALPALLRRCRSVELETDAVTYGDAIVLRGLADLPVRLRAA
jgi:cytochrome P450